MALNMTDGLGSDLWYHPVSKGVRSLFYVYTPGESSFESLNEVPRYVTKVSESINTTCWSRPVHTSFILTTLVKGQS